MSNDPREQALQLAHEMLSEQFPHVIVVVEAQNHTATGEITNAQLMRWYGDSTTATGLIMYAADLLTRRFGDRQGPPQPPPPLKAPQDDALVKSVRMLGEHFSCVIVAAQSEAEFQGTVERSVKVIRCHGGGTTAAGLAQFACNALRRMAVGM
jgi:hypothetical protein